MYNFKFEISSRANPYLSDIFNILHDFDLSHNLSIVLTSSEYSGYRFSHYFFFRNRLKLKDEDKLRISKIITESPIQITDYSSTQHNYIPDYHKSPKHFIEYHQRSFKTIKERKRKTRNPKPKKKTLG